MSKENFISALQTGYTSKGDFITLGAGIFSQTKFLISY
jgi:hypothetical protein